MNRIINKLNDILKSQTALIEKYSGCQLEMDEKGYVKEAGKLSELHAALCGSTESLKELIADCKSISSHSKN
jgi:hypothetical protein